MSIGLWKALKHYWESRRPHTWVEHMPQAVSFLLRRVIWRPWVLIPGWAFASAQAGSEGKDRVDKHLAECWRYATWQIFSAFCQKWVVHIQWGSTSGLCHIPLICEWRTKSIAHHPVLQRFSPNLLWSLTSSALWGEIKTVTKWGVLCFGQADPLDS